MTPVIPFHQRLLPTSKGKGFRQDGYWVWCGSVVKGEDARYHMFAARWPRRYPFFHGYLAASEIVRASADDPTGPYEFEEVVLPARGPDFWDGRMTHNPFIIQYGNELLLFYIGATYDGDVPSPAEMDALRSEPRGSGKIFPWYSSIRIGMARAASVFGPWKRPESPALDINPDGWDNTVVTNPSPCVTPDGRILLYYRSSGAKLGRATATSPDAPFVRQGDGPVVDPGEGFRIEDPFVFWANDHYEMVCKDLTGQITGEFHAAVHMLSDDGIAWALAPDPKAWSRTIHWDDGSSTTQASIERPFILFDKNGPAYLFAATADGPGPRDGRPGHYFAENTWNMVIPLINNRIIEVVDYRPEWPVQFRDEALVISKVLPEEVDHIHHVGSTAVPGLKAKPVIDIVLEVKDVNALDAYDAEMETLGYISKGEYGIPGRRFYLKGLYDRTHHIHAFNIGSDHVQRHLAFRDYLIAHPQVAAEYADLKTQCAAECDNDNDRYCDGKEDFIQLHEAKALEWAGQQGL